MLCQAGRPGQDGSRAEISLPGMVWVGRNREEQGGDSAGAMSWKNDLWRRMAASEQGWGLSGSETDFQQPKTEVNQDQDEHFAVCS